MDQVKSGFSKNNFGQRLKLLRIQKGYHDIDKWALELGISRSTAYNYENRDTPPSAHKVKQIASLLKMDILDVIGRNPVTVQESASPYSVNRKPSSIRYPSQGQTEGAAGEQKEPTEQDCLDYLQDWLESARGTAGLKGYCYTQLRLHLPKSITEKPEIEIE